MKIAMVIAGAGSGGMETHVRCLAEELAKRHDVVLLAHESIGRALPPGVRFIALNALKDCHRRNPFLARKLLKTLQGIAPDLVHAHGSKVATILSGRRFARYPLVATVHGIKRHLRFARRFDRLIAVSPAAAARLPKDKTTVIPNGVATPFATPPPRPFNSRPRLLAVGRLAPVKAFDRLIRALAQIPEAELRIAGDGPERERLQRLVDELHLSERVQLLGHRDDIPALLAESDLLLISSQREGLPLVLAEAIHAGCPVLSTPAGGIPDLLPREFLAPHEAIPAALAHALSHLEAYTAAFERFAAPLRQRLTIPAMAQATEAVYAQALTATRPVGCPLAWIKHPSLALLIASLPLIAISPWFALPAAGLLAWSLCDYTLWRPPAPKHLPRVLMYHALGEEVPKTMPPELCVRPQDFRQQIQLLAKKGTHFLFASELLAPQKNGPSVAITFDDGFQSVAQFALPILREFNAKATIFLSAKSDIPNVPLMDDQTIQSLANDPLIEWGSHTLDHPNLAILPPQEGLDQIRRGRQRVEHLVGRNCPVFAYPYGRFREQTPDQLKADNFLCALTVKKGIQPITDPYRIRRTNVLRSCDRLQFLLLLRSGRYRV